MLRIFGLSALNSLRLIAYFHSRIKIPGRAPCSAFSISNRVRNDGGGSQVLYAMMALAVANLLGVAYHHRSFREVAHVVGDGKDFVDSWNSAFDFLKLNQVPENRQVFSIDSPLQSARAILGVRNGVSITSSKFRYLVDQKPSCLDEVRPHLRLIYRPGPNYTEGLRHERFVTLHARRGDVTPVRHPGRWSSGQELSEDFFAIRRYLEMPNAKAEVVTDENSDDVSDLDPKLFLKRHDSDPLQAFERLVKAEVLVTGRSSFSYVAALLSLNTIVYRDFWHPPMPGWLSLRAIRYGLDKVESS